MGTPAGSGRLRTGRRDTLSSGRLAEAACARGDSSTRILAPSSETRRLSALETAQRAVEGAVAEREDVVAAYVGGSSAEAGTEYWSDVDLRVVVTGPDVPASAFVLADGVPLEWAFIPAHCLTDLEVVRRHPFLAGEIASALILHDPSGLLVELQATLVHEREAARYAVIRASTLLRRAVERMGSVEDSLREAGPLSLWDYRCAVFWGVESALIRVGRRPTHRRGLSALRDAVDALPGSTIYDGALRALGADQWTRETALGVWQGLRRVLAGLPSELCASHHYLAADRRGLWDTDVSGMIDMGEFREAALPIWTLMALAWGASEGVGEAREGCARLLSTMGFERPHGVALRVEACRAWMSSLVDWIGLSDQSEAEPGALFDETGPPAVVRLPGRGR